MPSYLETQVDKFTFRVASDRFYDPQGLWIQIDGTTARIGISDFVQQRSGDVAFAEVKPGGTRLTRGEEFAAIETIKVTIAFTSPLTGNVRRVNPALETTPEVINQDPYGEGWLIEITAEDEEIRSAGLLDAPAYFTRMEREAQEEARK